MSTADAVFEKVFVSDGLTDLSDRESDCEVEPVPDPCVEELLLVSGMLLVGVGRVLVAVGDCLLLLEDAVVEPLLDVLDAEPDLLTSVADPEGVSVVLKLLLEVLLGNDAAALIVTRSDENAVTITNSSAVCSTQLALLLGFMSNYY